MRTTDFQERLAAAAAPPPQPACSPADEVFVSYSQLAEHGVVFTRVHIRRLIADGLFPPPVLLSANRIAWRRSELMAWMASRPVAPIAEQAGTTTAASRWIASRWITDGETNKRLGQNEPLRAGWAYGRKSKRTKVA